MAQLGARGITGFDQNSTLSYVISTDTEANSLNQDFNDVPKNYDGALFWSTLESSVIRGRQPESLSCPK